MYFSVVFPTRNSLLLCDITTQLKEQFVTFYDDYLVERVVKGLT